MLLTEWEQVAPPATHPDPSAAEAPQPTTDNDKKLANAIERLNTEVKQLRHQLRRATMLSWAVLAAIALVVVACLVVCTQATSQLAQTSRLMAWQYGRCRPGTL